MNPYSVVILSRCIENLQPCLTALAAVPGISGRVIVVDDGAIAGANLTVDQVETGESLMYRTFRPGQIRLNDYPVPPRLEAVSGAKPFVFARNVNIGIAAAGNDDVILLNDDALLRTAGGFELLSQIAHSAEGADYGVISALISNGGACAPDQCEGAYRQSVKTATGLRPTRHHMLAFVCVFIPRHVIDQVGRFDEQFVGYGYDDDDYCKRVKHAGLTLGVFDGCYIEHGFQTTGLKSSFRNHTNAGPNMLAQNRKLFIDKWGGPQ